MPQCPKCDADPPTSLADATASYAAMVSQLAAAEKRASDYRELFLHAAFALWGQPSHKQDEADQAVVAKMKKMGIDWNGDDVGGTAGCSTPKLAGRAD